MPYKDPEKAKAYRRQHYLKNKAKYNERAQVWYEANKEEVVKRAIESRSNRIDYKDNLDREKLLERNRRYHEAHKDEEEYRRVRKSAARRRRYNIQLVTKNPQLCAAYERILEDDICSYCGKQSDSVDHIQAIAEGGHHEWENFTACCRSCNSSKGTKSLLWFLHFRD